MEPLRKYLYVAKKDLFHLCRSITGEGVRKTFKVIKSHFPRSLKKKIKSGTKVYDWKIPPEWNVRGICNG